MQCFEAVITLFKRLNLNSYNFVEINGIPKENNVLEKS